MSYNSIEDLEIIKALYNGNHLSDNELERAEKILFLLNKELGQRLKLFIKTIRGIVK